MSPTPPQEDDVRGFDPTRVAWAAERLTDLQKAFLAHGKHTLEDQPATPLQWDYLIGAGFYVPDLYEDVWFASGQAHCKGDGRPWTLTFRYNAFGLALREYLDPSSDSAPSQPETPE